MAHSFKPLCVGANHIALRRFCLDDVLKQEQVVVVRVRVKRYTSALAEEKHKFTKEDGLTLQLSSILSRSTAASSGAGGILARQR